MTATVEGDAPAVEQPVEEVKAPEAPKPVKEKKPKAPKEKKPKAPKEKKPKAPKEKAKQAKTASHPPYFQMIKEALLALNEKGGSSPYAIAKYMEEKHKSVLPANFKKMMSMQLKNQAARGKLVKIKASYKLSEATKPKKEKKAVTGKKANPEKQQQRPKRNRTVTASAPKSKKSEAVKKAAKKKKTKKVSAPSKPKQPKSIKSPSKRARKATVATA